jgi:iron-sulfur cluster repair protein YtfE (RIC family)
MIYQNELIRQMHWLETRSRFEQDSAVSKELMDVIEDPFLEPNQFNAKAFDKFELNHTLPKIGNTVHQLYAKFGGEFKALIGFLLYLDAHRVSLIKHIMHEEQVLFLFVENLLKGNYSEQHKNFVLTHFLHTHNNEIILQLDHLKAQLTAIHNELQFELSFQILFDQLANFQHDLEVHGLIEDQVFIDKILSFIQVNFNEHGA